MCACMIRKCYTVCENVSVCVFEKERDDELFPPCVCGLEIDGELLNVCVRDRW